MTATVVARAVLAAPAVTEPLSLPKAVSAGWVVAAIAAALLVGYGMKRLADHVLVTKGEHCRLEGDQ
jgi:hypothetical protein